MGKFDLSMTKVVDELLRMPLEARDENWRNTFLNAIVDASMAGRSPQVLRGPDGFPYFCLDLPPSGTGFTPFCISHILDHCLESSLGIVVAPGQGSAAWVFSFGSLLNFSKTGKFYGDDTASEQMETVEQEREVLVGMPDPILFPDSAREGLKRLLGNWKFMEGRVPSFFMLNDFSQRPDRSLVFNFFRDDVDSEEDFNLLRKMVKWFVPDYLGLITIERDSNLCDYLQPI
jgi:hypothetical protein